MPHDPMVHASDQRGRPTELDALVIGAGLQKTDPKDDWVFSLSHCNIVFYED